MISRNSSVADQPTIAIVGFSARAAAQCATRQGFEVVAVDFCADRDLFGECLAHYRLDDPNWPNTLNALHPSAPLLLTGGMEHRLELVDQCHSVSKRFGPIGKQLAGIRSLDNWAKWAVSCDIGWPVTLRGCLDECLDESGLSEQLLRGGWLLKPFQSAGGIGITDLINASQLSESVFKDHSKVYLQQRHLGETIGITFLSSEFGSTLMGAAAAWPDNSKARRETYIYRGSFGPFPLTTAQIDKLQRFASLVGRESGLLGLWQADFLEHNGEITLLEINPRWSASMDILDVCLDLPLVETHYACIRTTLSQARFEAIASKACKRAQQSSDAMLGKWIVYARAPFTVSQTQSDAWWMNRWEGDLNSVRNGNRFADIPCVGTEIAEGDPILTIMTTNISADFAGVLSTSALF